MRYHRILDAKTGEVKVTPFTPEEEAKADQWEADAAAKEALRNDPAYRIDQAFPQTDVARVIFEAFFEIANRLQALEGKQEITRAQLRDWLKSLLPN